EFPDSSLALASTSPLRGEVTHARRFHQKHALDRSEAPGSIDRPFPAGQSPRGARMSARKRVFAFEPNRQRSFIIAERDQQGATELGGFGRQVASRDERMVDAHL